MRKLFLKKKRKIHWAGIFWIILIIFAFEIIFSYMQNPKEKSGHLYQIISTGQSLSVGAAGKPALTTTQPFENKMLDRFNTILVPLVEPSNTLQMEGGETMGSAMANHLSMIGGKDFQTVVTNNGYGGYDYNQLKKGTASYEIGIGQLKTVHAEAERLGKDHKVIGVTVVHGENDQIGIWNDWKSWQEKGYKNPEDVYADFLKAWQKDYENDVRVITGQEDVPLYTDQMSSHSGAGSSFPISAIGQLKAADENPRKIILVGPKYFLDYADNFHLKNYSYRLLGEYYGKVIDQVFNNEKIWKPLEPIEIKRSDNIIYVKFHVPDGATRIEFDAQNVDPMPNMGFEYWDSDESAKIKNIEIVSFDTVKITLDKTPKENSLKKISYAYSAAPGAIPGAHSQGSAKGNLRDNDPTTSVYDPNIHLYDWAVHFSQEIK